MAPRPLLKPIESADYKTAPADCGRDIAWHVVYSTVNCEQVAAQGLAAKGFEVYFPQEDRKIVHARKVSVVKRPLFPRYLFVAFDISRDAWSIVQRTRGVERLLCNGDIPQRVPDGVIEAIQAIQAAELVGAFKPISVDGLNPGDFVEIIAGPFASWIAEVKSAPDAQSRVNILINLFGRPQKAKISIADLRRTTQR